MNKEPTFNDLIDKAIQAFKDKIIVDIYIDDDYIEFNTNSDSFKVFNSGDGIVDHITTGIKLIDSLYGGLIIDKIEMLVSHDGCISNVVHMKSSDNKEYFRLTKG